MGRPLRLANRCSPVAAAPPDVLDRAQGLRRPCAQGVRLFRLDVPLLVGVCSTLVSPELHNLNDVDVVVLAQPPTPDVRQPVRLELHLHLEVCSVELEVPDAPPGHNDGLLRLVRESAAEGWGAVVCLLTEAECDVEGLHVRVRDQALFGGLRCIKVAPWGVVVVLLFRWVDEDVRDLLLHYGVLGRWGDGVEG